MLGGLDPTALSDLMLQPDSQQYRFLRGGGEASKITKQDKSLFSQAKSAMRVRGGEEVERKGGKRWGSGGEERGMRKVGETGGGSVRSEKAKGLCLIVSAESHVPNAIGIHVRLCSSNTLQH